MPKLSELKDRVWGNTRNLIFREWLRAGILLLAALLIAVPAAWSQGNQGAIEGSVVDSSGA